MTVVDHRLQCCPSADPVLLDADPLADNGHTREISAVILSGKFLAPDDLDQIQAGARSAAGPVR